LREQKANRNKQSSQKREAFLRAGHQSPAISHRARSERGNFLLQALLAITLIIAFMPMLANKIATQSRNADMAATVSQLDSAATAARIFVRENSARIQYGATVVGGDDFTDLLEPFGLPLGFIPRTPIGQEISLIMLKKDAGLLVLLDVGKGKLSERQRAELAARIGFWAAMATDEKKLAAAGGEWSADVSGYEFGLKKDSIYIQIPDNKDFSELVRRNERDPDKNKFLTDLDMGKFSIGNIGALLAQTGKFGSAQMDTLSLFGLEDGRKLKNKFGLLTAAKASFQGGADQSALSVAKGVLTADNLYAKTISGFGDAGNLTANKVSVYDFTMSAGHAGFAGPAKWEVGGSLIMENASLSLERMELGSSLNAAGGKDVSVDPNNLSYISMKSGIETVAISAANITVRDQISSALQAGGSGPVLVDVRVAGTSILPDIWLAGINNGDMAIISSPDDNSGKTTDCKNIVNSVAGRAGLGNQVTYNQASLMQNIVCQYIFWERLEKRINIKKCMLEGKSNCS